MTKRGSAWISLSTLLLLGGTISCTIDDDVVRDIGAIQLYFTDPGIVGQKITDDSDTDPLIQVSEWDIQTATLALDGNVLDLLFGEPCRFVDTARVAPIPDGACAGGIVIGTNTEALTATLTLEFTMKVRRAEPVALDPAADEDGDNVDNGTDLCPLIADPANSDVNSDGVGDICSVLDPLSGTFAVDNDSDGIPDTQDNCVDVPNPGQEDTTGVALTDGTHVPDGIGDVCTEQTIDVDGGATINTSIQIADFMQPGQAAFLSVDFDDQIVLDCDWSMGTCTLDPAMLQMCVRTSLLAALLGC